MGYCTHESRLVLRSAEIQPFIPRFVRFSCAIDLCRLIVQICTPTNTYTHTHTIGSIHIGSTHTHTHTHTYRVARHLLPGALLLYTPLQRPGVVSLATVPAPTHVCVCLCAHACCTGKRRPGLFSLRFSSRGATVLCVHLVEAGVIPGEFRYERHRRSEKSNHRRLILFW